MRVAVEIPSSSFALLTRSRSDTRHGVENWEEEFRKRYITSRKDPHWYWRSTSSNGYGTFKDNAAHRVSFCLHNGLELEDIRGKIVRHMCHIRACVNPSHLELGTASDNAEDTIADGFQWPNSRHTDTDIRDAFELYIELKELKAVGRRLGIHDTTIGMWIRGETIRSANIRREYKHLLPPTEQNKASAHLIRKAFELYSTLGSHSKVAIEMGMPLGTVSGWLTGKTGLAFRIKQELTT
jgi:hypothetical protein